MNYIAMDERHDWGSRQKDAKIGSDARFNNPIGVVVDSAGNLYVASYMCRGKDNKEIAAACGVSHRTIKTHASAILKALGVANRTQAVLAARRLGLPTD